MDVRLPFTGEEIVLRQRYEIASLANDLLIAVWFIVGSVFYFFPTTSPAGTWCFLFGSVQLAVRPAIRLARRVHLRRIGPQHDHESSQDY